MLTIMLVLAGWVVLSLPLGMLVGSLFGHQHRFLPELGDAPAPSPAPREPAQAGVAA